jgi:hypothetical protein
MCEEETGLALLKHFVSFNSTVNSIVLLSSRKKGIVFIKIHLMAKKRTMGITGILP